MRAKLVVWSNLTDSSPQTKTLGLVGHGAVVHNVVGGRGGVFACLDERPSMIASKSGFVYVGPPPAMTSSSHLLVGGSNL